MKQPIRILLIEDNMMDAELTMRSLKKHPMVNDILHLKDGQEAIDYIEGGENQAQLILLDLNMPKVDGIEVLRKLKSTDQIKAVPVVILTSSNQPVDIKSSYHTGANSFIVKPVKYNDFTRVIDELCHYWTKVNQPNN